MPKLRAIRDLKWTGRVFRSRGDENAPLSSVIYVFIEGRAPYANHGWVSVIGHEIGNLRRVWRFEWDTSSQTGPHDGPWLPWVKDVTESRAGE